MAYVRRRRRTMRRRTTRRRLPMRNRALSIRRPPVKALKVHHFKRMYKGDPITTGGADIFIGLNFALSYLPNATDFTNLFDQYRINKVVVKYIPNRTEASAGTASELEGQFTSVLDFNDATPVASMNELYEYENFRLTRGTRIHTRVFTPASIDAIQGAPGIQTGNPTWKQWISTQYPDVPHFGMKVGIEANPLGAIAYVPYVTLYFSCKSVK